MKFLPSSSVTHDSLHHISRLLGERLQIEESCSGQVEQWLTAARSVSAEDPYFATMSELILTTGEDLVIRRQKEAALRSRLEGVKRAIKSFDDLFDPLRNKADIAGQHESGAEHARAEAKARYVDWITQKDRAPRVRTTIFRDVFRQGYRKRFDEASRSLKQRCSNVHAARLSFTNYLSREADSLALYYQDIMEGIGKFISVFAEWQQSLAGALNASGAKLWHSANAVSSATLTGRFLEVLWEESDSINPDYSLCYALSLQNEYPNLPKCFGFPLSQYSCPKETQLVVSLLKGLLVQTTGGVRLSSLEAQFDGRNEVLQSKVKIEQNWGTNPDEDQSLLSSLSSRTCLMLFEELLRSFPEPILDPTEVSQYSLSESVELLGPARNRHIDKMNLLVVASVHGHPQGEILQAIHSHVVSHGWLNSEWKQTLHYLLTHRERWIEGFPQLIRHYNKYVVLLSKIAVVQHPLEVPSFS